MDVGAVDVDDPEIDDDRDNISVRGAATGVGFCSEENNGPWCPITVNATFPPAFPLSSPENSSAKSKRSALRNRSRVMTSLANSSKCTICATSASCSDPFGCAPLGSEARRARQTAVMSARSGFSVG